MYFFKKFTPLSALVLTAYPVWLWRLMNEAGQYITYEPYAYLMTCTLLFACFFLALQVSNKSYFVKLFLVLAPYLVWVFWLSAQNIDQFAPSLFVTLLIMGIVSFMIAVFLMSSDFTRVDTHLLANGEKAQAKILGVEDNNITVAGTRFAVTLTVEVNSQSRGVFVSKVQTLVSRVQVPRPGDMITVAFDPENLQKIEVVNNPA